MYEYIIRSLKNGKSIIIDNGAQSFPKQVYSKDLPSHEGFIASKIHARNKILLQIKNEHFFIIDGYVTYRRYVKTIKKESYKTYLFVFKKKHVSYETDENEIINYLENEKVSYKKDFNAKNLQTYYFFAEPAYAIITETEYEEIPKNKFSSLKHELRMHNAKLKRTCVNKKINDINKKINDITNDENKK